MAKIGPMSLPEDLCVGLIGVISEILRLESEGDLSSVNHSSFLIHFRRYLPWLIQAIRRHTQRVDQLVSVWRDRNWVSDVDHDIMMNIEKYKFDDYKTLDIETVSAGTLCATLTAHLRLSHGDYNGTLFRNVDDVTSAYGNIKPCLDTDVDEFIRTHS